MASLRSLHFLFDPPTTSSSSVLTQSRPGPSCWVRPCLCVSSKCKGLRVSAMGKGSNADDDNDNANSLETLAEKSKKVLSIQKDLLHKVAERRKLISSIKSNAISSKQDIVSDDKNNRTSTSEALERRKLVSSKQSSFNSIKQDSLSDDINDRTSTEGTHGRRQFLSIESSAANGSQDNASYDTSSRTSTNDKFDKRELVSSSQSSNISAEQDTVPSAKSDRTSSSETLERKYNGSIMSDGFVLSTKPKFSEPPGGYDRSSLEKENEVASNINITSTTVNVEAMDEVNTISGEEFDEVVEEETVDPSLVGVDVMNILIIAAECAPWSKTGGLGDVAGALPKALAKRGHRVMVVAPRYSNYAEPKDTGVRKSYKVAGQDMEVTYFHAYIDGVDFVFIDHSVFQHCEKDIYSGDRLELLKRMVLFCKAAVEVPWLVPCGGVCYGDGNLVFVANDWHTALLPVYLKVYYRDQGLMKYARSVLVIHNIAHQGRGPVDDFSFVDLPWNYIDLFKLYDPIGGDHFNIFAAGLKCADRLVTVSQGYAWELKTSEGGWGLHGIINESDWKFQGIVNGIDTKDWNPDLDVHLKSDGYTNYSLETLDAGKRKCKAALQRELGLPVRDWVPLIAFIGRLDPQKGVDLIGEAMPWIVGQHVQLVMLGTGRHDLEDMLRRFEGENRDKVRGWVGFSVKMSHRITAGADILLMPSRFEPCGLNQLYAMNYGTVPVVHAVGGLRDTVAQFDPYNESGYGWTFPRAEAGELIHALGNCLNTYWNHKSSWKGIQRRGMMQDLSWDSAAQRYEEVFVAAKYHW